MFIAIILLLAGIPLFLLLAPSAVSNQATSGFLKEDDHPESAAVAPQPGSESYVFELQLRGEAHRHG